MAQQRASREEATRVIAHISNLDTTGMTMTEIMGSVRQAGFEIISEKAVNNYLNELGKKYVSKRLGINQTQRIFNREVANLLITIAKIADENLVIPPIIWAMASETLEME